MAHVQKKGQMGELRSRHSYTASSHGQSFPWICGFDGGDNNSGSELMTAEECLLVLQE